MFEVQKLYNECSSGAEYSDAGIVVFIDALTKIGVDVRDYPEHKMWLLDYNAIECIKNHPVVNECRGLMMAYDGSIVRKGFNRFYNLGENGVDTFDFANSIAFEKADGSLCFIYWCEPTNRWEIGTRGTAFAEGPKEFYDHVGTFREGMLTAMGRTEKEFQSDCSRFDKDVTRLYEYVSPDNRIVTPYKESMLIALSFINKITGDEVVAPPAAIERHSMKWNVREIRQYEFKTQDDCLKTLGELSGLEEGYVVRNFLTGERIKIKSPVYVAAHRLRGNGLTLGAICELVVMNEHPEYIAVFPEDAHKFISASNALTFMLGALQQCYEGSKNIETQKDFALAVKDLNLSGVMFKARKNGTDVIHEFNQFPVARRAEWLKERLL